MRLITFFFSLCVLAFPRYAEAAKFEYQWLDTMPPESQICAKASELLRNSQWVSSSFSHFSSSDKVMAIRIPGSHSKQYLHFSLQILFIVNMITPIDKNGSCLLQKNGSGVERKDRPIDSVAIFFEIPQNDSIVFVETATPFNVEHQVVDGGSMNSLSQANLFLNALYMGAVLALTFYNLFLWFSTRNRIYFAYSAYMFCMMLFFGFLNHILFYYLPIFPKSHYGSITLAMSSFALVFLVSFAQELLDVKHSADHFSKAFFKLATLVCLLALGVNALFPPGNTGVRISNFAYLVPTAALVYGSLRARPSRSKKFFLYAFLPFLVSIIVFILQNGGVIESTFFTENAMQFFQALEGVIFSFALGDKLKQEQTARFSAELQVEKEKERTLRAVHEARMEQMGFVAMRLADRLNSPLQVIQMNMPRLERLLPHLAQEQQDQLSNVLRTLKSSSAKIQENISPLRDFCKYAPEDSLQKEIKDFSS